MTDTLRDRIAAALLARIKQAVIIDPGPFSGMVGQPFTATMHDLADAVLPLVEAEREAAADTAEDVANELFAAYDTEQGNGAMAVAARLRARTGATHPATTEGDAR